ncbi:hypothetical protein [Planctomycetes bacterium TBK1r]|uniref:Uncharacterized protein n=1 Tax=Stieleria magnilauensis TaxID=2527963 RepID=A0ABX5XGY4_9BACT|nr:hypothetical protein TBK1r_01540 [Planctomycetes bacterium TBK1r]
MGEEGSSKKDRRIRQRFRQCLKSFVKTGVVDNTQWTSIEPELGNHFYGDGESLSKLIKKAGKFFAMAGLPVLPLSYGGAEEGRSRRGKRISLKLRPFVLSMAENRQRRDPLVVRCMKHEDLMPRPKESIYIGTGTTMRFLAERLIQRIEEHPFEIATDNIEILGLCYFQAGHALMKQGVLSFLGHPVDWDEGTIDPSRSPSSFQTAYLSISALTDEGEFCTRDKASELLTYQALQAKRLNRVVFLMEGEKIGTPGHGNFGGPVRFGEINKPPLRAYLVTDQLNANQRALVDGMGITIIDYDPPVDTGDRGPEERHVAAAPKDQVLDTAKVNAELSSANEHPTKRTDSSHPSPPKKQTRSAARKKRDSEKDSSQ